jgi:error-prone DNA polymerase
MGIICARDLQKFHHGRKTLIAGCVIARQRPGTAKGFVFLSLEDETGISNAIVTPKVYEQYRRLVTYGKFLLLEGKLQNQDNVVSVKVDAVRSLEVSNLDVRSHDFH